MPRQEREGAAGRARAGHRSSVSASISCRPKSGVPSA
jgi:hypothetical protein